MNNSEIKTALIDGYLDEPSCLGVPPYLSPHIRYTYGALRAAGISSSNLTYFTIDQLRSEWPEQLKKLEGYDLVIIIAGTTVPGHYLGGRPITLKEITELGARLYYPQKVLGGPITLVKKKFTDYDYICGEMAASEIYQLLTRKTITPLEQTDYRKEWAVIGAEVSKLHPNYPNLVCELETFRGCPRLKHCAFCSERLKKQTYQRSPAEIIAEVSALARAGNHFYRLGCQSDLLLYQAQPTEDGLIPNPEAIGELYRGIRTADPQLRVLHLDNINPVTISKYPRASSQALATIVQYNTSGDVAAFGLESADPLVRTKNNIEADPALTLTAIRLLNQIGGNREQGLPQLLPGLNFLHGLPGESPQTLELNFNYLQEIYDAGLMLRRINIRQVVKIGDFPVEKIDHQRFLEYKKRVNQEINQPMLRRVFPRGTILKNVLTETSRGKITYGRQLGSYPILIGIPGQLPLNHFITVRVIDHGYRSITALPWPFKLKKASPDQLITIPGIGKKRAGRIFTEQPENLQKLSRILGPTFPLKDWQDWFEF
ncbi:MAG: helix-hairpin-helix domain-containing protein [Halanaerobiales bacterium]|nr:helix-hairpin-helix domain-containing protein [Halanaerobiales bacterium]